MKKGCDICKSAQFDGFDTCPECGKPIEKMYHLTKTELHDMLRTLAKSIPCYACNACCAENLDIPCIDRKINYAIANPTKKDENEC